MELERLQKQICFLEKAYKTLEEAMSLKVLSDLEKAGTIQRFEYTIELTWKTLKNILKYEMWECNLHPREIFKEFYKIEAIEDLEVWFQLLKSRNVLSHCYNENISESSFMFLKENYKIIWTLINKLKIKYIS